MSTRPSHIVQQSWAAAAYDGAKHDMFPMSPVSTVHPLEPDEVQDSSLDPLWEKVWGLKARMLETLPSKVQSLDVAKKEAARQRRERDRKSLEEGTIGRTGTQGSTKVGPSERGKDKEVKQETAEAKVEEQARLKRKASASFRTSKDGRYVIAMFDMLGVQKHDMHVSFHPNKLTVTWRRIKTIEYMEENILVREKKDTQYVQNIPLPEGTRYDEIRASWDGERLVLRHPNFRCIRVEPRLGPAEDSRASSSTICSDEDDFITCRVAPSTLLEVFKVDRS